MTNKYSLTGKSHRQVQTVVGKVCSHDSVGDTYILNYDSYF